MILLVSHRGDDHLAPVQDGLRRRRARFQLLDTGRFPTRGRLDLRLGGSGPARLRAAAGPGTFEAGAVRAIWWRRPRPCAPDPRILLASHRDLASRSTAEALAGLLRGTQALWVNDPERETAAGHKAWQLQLARACGLEVPRTCITNDPARARSFLAELGPSPAIFKSLDADPATWRETRRVGPEERRLLGLVRHAPVIFQEYVPGVDLRVTSVGGRLFVAEIDARASSSPEDARLDLGRAPVRKGRLPREVAGGLRTLLARLGLHYAAVDLRRTDEGEHLFLEVNPTGQFLFAERRAGLPIAEALCDLLASPTPPPS